MVLILFDQKTSGMANDFCKIANKITSKKLKLVKMKMEKVHGVEPNQKVAKKC